MINVNPKIEHEIERNQYQIDNITNSIIKLIDIAFENENSPQAVCTSLWFSTESNFAPRKHLMISTAIFDWHHHGKEWEEVVGR